MNKIEKQLAALVGQTVRVENVAHDQGESRLQIYVVGTLEAPADDDETGMYLLRQTNIDLCYISFPHACVFEIEDNKRQGFPLILLKS